MKLIILFLALSCLPAFAKNPCAQYVNDCEYYLCVAKEKHCDENSYPLQFGHHFCLRYGERMKTFSKHGKVWINDVRKCLIKEMNQFEDQLTCRELQPRAFSSHVPCYVESGFCHLSLKDKRMILTTIWPTIRNIQVLTGGFQVMKSCLD